MHFITHKKMLPKCAFIIMLICFPTTASNYIIDTKNAHASITFSIKHLNFSKVTGRFENFTGNFIYDSEKLEASSVNITVETNSVSTNHQDRDNHLRSEDFLNVARFPLASFVSTKINVREDGYFDLIGELTLNGITKAISIKTKKIGEGKDPWGGYRAGFEGNTELNLTDFNIKFPLGSGSETVNLNLNIEGIKQL